MAGWLGGRVAGWPGGWAARAPPPPLPPPQPLPPTDRNTPTGKSSRTWSVTTVPLRLAVLNGFQVFFGPKMAVCGPKLQLLKLRSATCESRSRPPLLSFLLKLCVIVLHTHRYHPPKFHRNVKHHDGVPFRACCLLAACLLAAAAAKPGRSTVDTKKGYKTKTGSTSSVNLNLNPLIKREGRKTYTMTNKGN